MRHTIFSCFAIDNPMSIFKLLYSFKYAFYDYHESVDVLDEIFLTLCGLKPEELKSYNSDAGLISESWAEGLIRFNTLFEQFKKLYSNLDIDLSAFDFIGGDPYYIALFEVGFTDEFNVEL